MSYLDYKGLKEFKEKLYKYDDLQRIVKITDANTTMGEVSALLNTVNTAGDHVLIDVSALNAGMYLCTIYINSDYYRIYDLVTGYEGTGFWSDSTKLTDVIAGSGSTGRHYTARWDKTNSQMLRLNDAEYIPTTTTNFGHFGSVNGSYDNPFDDLYPWSERKLCNIDLETYMGLESGADITDCVTAWEGDPDFSYADEDGVWVYTPPFYGRSYGIGNYVFFDVSDTMTQGAIHYPAQITGRWHGIKEARTIGGESKNILLPKPGMPCKRERIDTIHGYAKNFGGSLVSIYELDPSLLLYLVEYASYEAQGKVGSGVSGLYRESSDKFTAAATESATVQVEYNATIAGLVIPGAIFDIGTANGGAQVGSFIVQAAEQDESDATKLNVTLNTEVTVTTDNFWSVHGLSNMADEDIGSKSGYIGTNGKANAYYRGEVLWGNLWQYVLGAYHQKTTNHVWLAANGNEADNYDAINTEVHEDTGIALSADNGWISALAFPTEKLSAPCFCTVAGASDSGSTNPVGDYFYNAPASDTILLVGGSAYNGPYGGPFSWNWGYSSAHSYWSCGGRPRLKSP